MKSYVFPGNIEERILRIAGEPFRICALLCFLK